MDLKLISRFKNSSLNMFLILIIFAYLTTFGFTSELSNNDFLTEKLHSAALQVISLHSNSLIDSINDELSQQPTETLEDDGLRSKRSVPSFFNIPVLNSSADFMIPDPELMRGHKISEMMNNLKERFLFQQIYLQKISDALKYAIKPNSNRLVITPNIIRNLTAFKGITANQIKTLTNIFWQNSKLTINDLKFKIKDLVNIVNSIKHRIGAVIQATSDVVLRNRPSIITGHKQFVGHIEVPFLNTSSAMIGSVFRLNLQQIMNNLYRKSRPQLVRGIKHILKPTFVKNSIDSRLINKIDFTKQIVTTNTPQIINGFVHFDSQLMITNDLTIRGKLNNFDLDRDLVFLNRPEIVLSPKIFTSPLINAQNVKTLSIDGIDLEKLIRNVLLSIGSQTINSKLILQKAFKTKSISVNAMVNDVDISAMATQLVYKNRPVLVRGPKIFILDDIHIKNNLLVRNRLDGQLIPTDLLLRSRDQVITAPKIFNGNTRFDGKVFVVGFVDGLRLPQDIVTLTQNEVIYGPIVFKQSIVANKDMDARHLVDGVDLSQLRLYSLKLNDRIIESNVRFNKPVIVGAIELRGDVNGINLGYLFSEAVFKDSSSVEITGNKFFDSHIQFAKIFVERVNGINLTDLVSTHKNEIIFSPKLFVGLTSFKSIDVKGLIGKINVQNLYNNRISLSKPQNIRIKNFLHELSIIEWLSLKSINGIVPQIDFVLKSKFQVIHGPKAFLKTFNAKKLIAINPTLVKGKIDNLLINDLNSRAIRLNTYQSFPLNIILMNSNSTFIEVFKQLNGLNITQFASNVMSVTKPQVVFAPKLFRNEQTFYRIHSSKGVSGISVSDLNANAVHLNAVNQIRHPFTFTHSLIINKPLVLNGVVNGVNLSLLAIDSVYKTGRNLISGHNMFKSGFRVNGSIHAFTLNGIDLSNELLTNTRDHIIRGKVKFAKTLNINGDIVLNERINGIDLSDFNKQVMKTNDRNIINGNLELIGETRVLKNLSIAGRMNGINLTQLFNSAVFLNSNDAISGIKTMIAPIELLSHLNTTDLNNNNIQQILNDIVFINSHNEQQIFAPKVFTNDITSNGLIQSKGIAIMGPINGVNIEKLNSESIKTNRPTVLYRIQNFNDLAIITNNFTQILGTINGIDLYKDVILLHRNDRNNINPQLITGNKVFEHLILNENAIINGLVNGYSLKAIESNTLFTTNDQTIIGHKIVRGFVEFSSGNIEILNGIRIPEDLVTLNDNQTIFAHLIFKNPLSVIRNVFVSGSVSGHNLTKLTTESLLKDKPQILSQPIKFDSIVFRDDVTVGQHVDYVDLSALLNNVKQFTSVVNNSKDLLVIKTNRHHYVSDYLFKSLEKSVFEIDSFNLYQTLDEIHGNHINVLSNDVFTISETFENPNSVHSIGYNHKTEIFETLLTHQNSNLIRKQFILNGQEFVIHMSAHSYNYSSQITKSGQLIATIGYFINSLEVLKVSENRVLLVSFHSNTAKLMVHSFTSLPNNKYTFIKMTEAIVGTDTSKVIAFLKQSQVYIVVAKYYGLNCVIDTTGTLIYILTNDGRLQLIQKIPLMNIVDVIHFENNGKDYLALSDGTAIESSLNPQTIYIYRSELMRQKCVFSLFQKLYFDNVMQLSEFTYGTTHSERQYLVAMNSSNIMIWKQSGESGFTDEWLLHTKSARVMAPIIAANKLYLIVGQSYKCHESLIFKADTKGFALTPIVLKSKNNLNFNFLYN